MSDAPQRSSSGSNEAVLIERWRAEAKRHEVAAQEPDMDPQECVIHDEAHRIYTKCAGDLAALSPQISVREVPDGYVIMPREATRVMTMAGCDSLPSCEHVFGHAGEMLKNAYRKMVEVCGHAPRSRDVAQRPIPRGVLSEPSIEIDETSPIMDIAWRDQGSSFCVVVSESKLVGISSTIDPPRSNVAWTVNLPAGLIKIDPSAVSSTPRATPTSEDREYEPGMNPTDDAEFGMKP